MSEDLAQINSDLPSFLYQKSLPFWDQAFGKLVVCDRREWVETASMRKPRSIACVLPDVLRPISINDGSDGSTLGYELSWPVFPLLLRFGLVAYLSGQERSLVMTSGETMTGNYHGQGSTICGGCCCGCRSASMSNAGSIEYDEEDSVAGSGMDRCGWTWGCTGGMMGGEDESEFANAERKSRFHDDSRRRGR
ncbi:hypothetical protein B0H17DRAFT_1139552 [Mycena rosella]|uniref:Uncharacterized protein n=1 Tax=Mycena rosella TaxID=1033263 RepID=A0AAD7G8E9_MYCRO|nr:hypothetical protein B0H17DRAFT_1139552 [Mycena rosella]